jgi:hypothetical protein
MQVRDNTIPMGHASSQITLIGFNLDVKPILDEAILFSIKDLARCTPGIGNVIKKWKEQGLEDRLGSRESSKWVDLKESPSLNKNC